MNRQKRGGRVGWCLAVGLSIGWGVQGWANPGVGTTQVPGYGMVLAGQVHSYQQSTAPSHSPYSASATLTVTGNTVINWVSSGGNGTFSLLGTGSATPGSGFNVGQGAYLVLAHTPGTASLLNIDATGNPSQILGMIVSAGASAHNFPIYIANGNGIIFGSNSVSGIVGSGGVGLLGYSLSTKPGDWTNWNGTVGVTQSMATGAAGTITIPYGTTLLTRVGSSILLAAPNVTINSSNQFSDYDPGVTHPLSILSGYAFGGFNASTGTYASAPTAITASVSGASAGSITFTGLTRVPPRSTTSPPRAA